ncbi:myb family transcription factor EFM [Rhodamnia argentea]|uniref:Myb family transcription factor EFM n=1 Tax=Rhodamnia argentea TaxID=178133 RepID=A0A8B8R370_9MYRT|nr:myb family transcription factor EFM [Rhodamnia argentea]
MASPSELTLECKPQSYSMLLKSLGDHAAADQTQRLEDFLARLEEERLKIDAFKRELPLCMQLLANAVEASKQQLQAYRANQGPRPVLEEFIPMKNSSSEGSEKTPNLSDKANWMTSAQLWSQTSNDNPNKQQPSAPKETEIGFTVSPKLGLDNKQRNGGAFLPFSKERNGSCPSPSLRALPELALGSPEKEMEDKKYPEAENGNGVSCSRRDSCGKIGNGAAANEVGKGVTSSTELQIPAAANVSAANTTTTNGQTHRKARRCWSPDLHRRFVNALQMLGGSQVATPKQIRELMKVDGLTNDEVKSHLQKYRLHTRRPSPSPQSAGAAAPQLVVLSGILMPPDYATAAAAAAAHGGTQPLYGAHPNAHASPHYCTPLAMPQEFYSATAAHHEVVHHHPLHGHHHHHQIQVYKGTSHPQPQSSPESGMRGGGGDGQSESIEDGKSESSSWKGDSGDHVNGGDQRKGLLTMRDNNNEESNGSEITLKFYDK